MFTNLSLHGKPLQDFVFGCHLGVILSEPPVNELAGFVPEFILLEKGFLSLRKKREQN